MREKKKKKIFFPLTDDLIFFLFLVPTKKHRLRGPSFKIGRVSLNAKTLLATLKELEPLDEALPSDVGERKRWILDFRYTN